MKNLICILTLVTCVTHAMLEDKKPQQAPQSAELLKQVIAKPSTATRPGTPMPKSPPIMAAAHMAKQIPPRLLKMATCGINIWCNEECDQGRWAHMVDLYRRLEDEPFNQKALIQTILEEIALSSNKKGNGIWGGLSFTYIKDSQKLDKEADPLNNE